MMEEEKEKDHAMVGPMAIGSREEEDATWLGAGARPRSVINTGGGNKDAERIEDQSRFSG